MKGIALQAKGTCAVVRESGNLRSKGSEQVWLGGSWEAWWERQVQSEGHTEF